MFGGNQEQFAGYGPIGGSLPWGGGDNGAAFAAAGQPPAAAGPALAEAYKGAYNSALAQNQSNYNNILAGYQQTLASQTSAQQAIAAGYSGLYNEVQARLASQGQTRAGDISAAATADLGRQTQSLIDRGLGNTTVQNSVQRSNAFDRERQMTANNEAVSGLQAASARDLGLAGLGFQQSASAANSALQARQLDWMNSTNAPYPNAALYAQLMQQAGASAQQRANVPALGGYNADAIRAASGGLSGGGGNQPQDGGLGGAAAALGSAGPRLGYVPQPAPNYGGGAYSPAGSGGGYNYGAPSSMFTVPAGFGASGVTPGYDKPSLDYGGGGDYGPMPFDFAGAGAAISGGAGAAVPSDFGEYWDDYN